MCKEEARINCQMFQKQESVIKNITDRINQTKEVWEKAIFAEELQEKADGLLTCLDYDDKKFCCKNCHFIADFRKKTAGLIVKAGKLGK